MKIEKKNIDTQPQQVDEDEDEPDKYSKIKYKINYDIIEPKQDIPK